MWSDCPSDGAAACWASAFSPEGSARAKTKMAIRNTLELFIPFLTTSFKPAHSKLLNTSLCSLNHFEDVHRRRRSGRLRSPGQSLGHGCGGLLYACQLIESRGTEINVLLIDAAAQYKLNRSLLACQLQPLGVLGA